MPLFPTITFWQHTYVLTTTHILVPLDTSVLHRVMYDDKLFGLFVSFFFFLFAGKHGFCTEINHALHKKAQLLTHLYNKTKQESRKTFKHFPLSVLLGKWITWLSRGDNRVFGCSVLWLCSHKRMWTTEEPALKQQVGSIALRMWILHCSGLLCAQDSLWDPGRQGFCCLHCREVI